MRLYINQADLRALSTVSSALNFAFNMREHADNKGDNTPGGEGGGAVV
jgi:hypothetical protein